jgi:tRNA-Thr(GGU) m(6)t(6)A37 methyltransferase TsaA
VPVAKPEKLDTRKLTLTPIGVAHTPFRDKRAAPRQPAAARGIEGTIELFARDNLEQALANIDEWSHLWVIFWFHHNQGWQPKVAPPRSRQKKGLFATRAPHRPNPLGLSVLRLLRVEGRVLHVSDVDLLDGTPILDLKPYVPYTDVATDANDGWLETATASDPGPRYEVTFEPLAREQLDWLAARSELPLERMASEALALGPAPHPYRRIRAQGDHFRLAVKDFRLRFTVEGTHVRVLDIGTGYRMRVLMDPKAQASEQTPLEVHRAFVSRFGNAAIY